MIRLSTSTIYQSGLNGILKNESDVNYLQQQISSGRRVVTPSDDPLAAGQAVTQYQNLNMTAAYASNRDVANRSLGLESNALGSVVSNLTNVLTRVVEAGNGTLADEDRNTLATVLEQARDALFALANSTDGNGEYLFSGTTGNAAAYIKDASGQIQYNGSAAGERLVQVEQSRQMSVSDLGKDIFGRAAPGATSYIATADAGNTGTATFTAPTVTPGGTAAGNNIGQNFNIAFGTDATGATTYTVTLVPSGTAIATDQPYQEGESIDMGGVSVAISGEPQPGDSFTVDTAQSSDVDLFGTLDTLITALKQPSQGDEVASSALTNILATSSRKLSINLDNVSTVQASVGARQNELDALDTTGTQRGMAQNKTLTDLTQIDYYSAVSEMSMRQLSLQASMAAFSAIKGTSLFSLNK